MDKIRKLMEDRMKLVKEMRALLDKCETEKRSLNTEEDESYRKMEADIESFETQIETEQKQLNRETRSFNIPEGVKTRAGEQSGKTDDELRSAAFSKWCRDGVMALSPEERRAMAQDTDNVGGYLVVPQTLAEGILVALNNQVFMRQICHKEVLNKADTLGAPVITTDVADAVWTAEVTAASEDSSLVFGKRELTAKQLTKLVKVSRKLLRNSATPPENIVRDRLVYKFGTVEENAFLNGSGSGEPLGVFTASASGINTDRDVSTGNTTTAITTDGLIEALYAIPGQYHGGCTWVFHRAAIKMIRKLKDGNGQYIWQPGMANNAPGTILDRPYFMSEYAPSTFTTGLYVGIVGFFQHYWICDALDMEIQRVDELYAATNQVGFIGRKETDGMPVLSNGFARVTLA